MKKMGRVCSLGFPLLLSMIGSSLSNDVILDVHRVVKKQGFHRDIQTKVSINPDDLVRPPGGLCSLLLIERLPSGLYVDMFQLDNMVLFGGPHVLTKDSIDIEAPEYLSKEHELFVYTPIPDSSSHQNPIVVTVTLPLHVRYHRPSPDPVVTHVEVTIYHPRVLLNCSRTNSRTTKAPCDEHNTSTCSWAELVYRSNGDSLKFPVPVGREEDVRVVVYGTIVVTVMGCSFLLYVIACFQWNVKVKDR